MATVVREVAERVFALRYGFFDQTVGLVVGDGICLIVDTRTTYAQARELQDDVRRITPHPWTVLNTHHHFDHTFGNALFRPSEIWGHRRCIEVLHERGDAMRDDVARRMPDLAAELEEIEIVPPTRAIDALVAIDVGGRRVDVAHLGRAHTDNDVVATVADGGVLFAGDLVEEGAPPSFGDSFPLDWPAADDRLLDLAGGPIVPGHGEVVDVAFVRAQRAELAEAARLAREAWADGAPVDVAGGRLPFPHATAMEHAERAYAQLEGRP
jgi:glyoxylase-like metal-dependent hydrolase (beta-lactamase superfamily II)